MSNATSILCPGPDILWGTSRPVARGQSYVRLSEATLAAVPEDTASEAEVLVGLRLAFAAGDQDVEIEHALDAPRENHAFIDPVLAVWRGQELLATHRAEPGDHTTRIAASGPGPVDVYLPPHMRPRVLAVRAGSGGRAAAAARTARWLAYGDSITGAWCVATPGGDWVSRASRALPGVDAINLGLAGAARGEPAVADEIAGLPADVITIAFGTNCWKHRPHTPEQLAAVTTAFLTAVRRGHPDTPIVLVSPIRRPDAEAQQSPLRATLADLREAMERATREAIAGGDARLTLVEGLPIVGPGSFPDGIHPDEAGHRAMAEAIGPVLAQSLRGTA